MKKNNVVFVLVSVIAVIFFCNCERKTSTLCENLLSQGTANPTSLEGKWKFECFAYSADGNKIKDKDVITRGELTINDSLITFFHTNSALFKYNSGANNGISLSGDIHTLVEAPQEEEDVMQALNSAQCYVVKQSTLDIHYTTIAKKNVLRLTKM
jgi:hypothetical protein